MDKDDCRADPNSQDESAYANATFLEADVSPRAALGTLITHENKRLLKSTSNWSHHTSSFFVSLSFVSSLLFSDIVFLDTLFANKLKCTKERKTCTN